MAPTLAPPHPPATDDASVLSGRDAGGELPFAIEEDLAVAQRQCDALDRDPRVWPGVVHHHLRGGNALRAPGGMVRIIDWSQAVVTHSLPGGTPVPARAGRRRRGGDAPNLCVHCTQCTVQHPEIANSSPSLAHQSPRGGLPSNFFS